MTGLTDSPHTAARARPHHAVAGWLLASVALHALALMALPRFGDNGAQPSVRVLDVVVLMRDPQPGSRPESASMPAAVAAAPAVSRTSAASRTTSAAAERQTPRAETVPAPESVTRQGESPAVSPAARSDAASSAAAETGGTAPPAPARAAAAVPAEAPLTPPLFNAAYLRNPPPRYPLAARRNGEQGTVTLRVLVDREGLPASVAIEKTSGYAPLDNAAREAVRAWRFAPARRGNQAVEAWVLVPVVFRLEDAS